ncbi:MAG: DegT/DnrJ/EryC1/StrS family aminotransferase [Clostridia bacterium]|nr:DegT/DnrJ/EryC1/StrS family aminotransferase [Clostridia bacterium]
MRKIPFSPPDITEAEINEVIEALKSGWITTGPRVKQFEKNLAEFTHADGVVCLSSATASEELNLRILGVGPGDEVLVPAYTYTATASAVIHTGATVKFIDSQKDSVEMDYDAMEAAITEKTKAIVPVDLAGIICDYDRIFQAVENKKHLFQPNSPVQEALGRIAVVADCAHALGATRKGKSAGEIADFSSFSFHAVKNLTTAEGGAAAWKHIPGISDEELYKQYQLYSLHGQSKDALAKTQLGAWEYDIVGPWYKCNMTDIQAAIGLKQLERYPDLLKRRQEIIKQYDEALDELGILHLQHSGEDFQSSGHLYLSRIPGADESIRNAIITKLAEQGIATNVHYKPLPMMSAYKNFGWSIEDFPHAYKLYQNEITLPLHTTLTDEDVTYIKETLIETVKRLG